MLRQDKTRNFLNKTHKYTNWYLLFASGHVPRVDIIRFEGSKKELARRSIVAVRACKKHRNIKTLENFHSGVASMIRRIVKKYDCVITPPWAFSVKLEYQSPEENFHYLAVIVSLNQTQVNVAFSI
jgi:hypothetical protein